ncbi:hypothetical protein DFQ27_002733, partial [Actinomortierella ambigua]
MTTPTTLLTLFCLADGETTSNAFSVKAPHGGTVDDLKELIKAKKAPRFDDVAVDELTLWCVSIPVSEDDDETSILVDNVISDHKKKLNPLTRLTKVFPEELPEETIHIIVQRPPPQVHALVKRSVQRADIQQELATILRGVEHCPTTPTIDPKDIEASQRKSLGPFFKRTLPHGKTATDVKLVMLGLELDKQAKTSDGKTLRSIVEDDIGRSIQRVVAMVAPSGSGKTATVIDLATKHF